MGRSGLGRLALDMRTTAFAGTLGMHHLAHHHGGNGVFKDQLLLVVCLEHDRILVEGPNTARQLHSAQQINSNERFVFTSGVQKRILNVLRRLVVHRRSPLVWGEQSWAAPDQANRTRQYDSVLPLSFQPVLAFSLLLYNPARFSPPSAAARKTASLGVLA